MCLRLHRGWVPSCSPAFSSAPTHHLISECFDFIVHLDLHAPEGPTVHRLRQEGAGRGLTLHRAGAQPDDLILDTVARACPLPGARAHDSIGESGRTGKRSHAAAPRSQVPSVEKATFTLCSHRTPRHGRCIRESGDGSSRSPARRSCRTRRAQFSASLCFLSRPGPSARLGRRPPAASFPPGPPNLGTPLIARLLRKLAK